MRIFYDEAAGGEAGTAGGEAGTGSGEAGAAGTGIPGTGEVKLPEGAFMTNNFREALPEDLRGHASLAKVADLEGMARSLVNAQAMIGKDPSRLVEIPTDDKPEELRAVLTKLGAPADASGYTLTPTEGAPEWLGVDQEMSKGFLEHAAKEGFLPSQTQGTYAWFTGVMANAAKTAETKSLAEADTNIRQLEAEFGGAFDQKIAVANHGIDKVGGEELRKVLNDAGLGANPVVLKAFLKVGGLVAEDNAGDGGTGGTFGNRLSPDEARSKGKALLEQASKTGVDQMERRRLNEEAQVFFQMAAPGNVPSTL